MADGENQHLSIIPNSTTTNFGDLESRINWKMAHFVML